MAAKEKQEKMKYTSFEKARLIGARALQISQGAPFAIKLSEEELARIKYNPIEIAKIEYEQDKIPMDVRRKMPE
jgi:DNA-directed RNA polymerase subunit K